MSIKVKTYPTVPGANSIPMPEGSKIKLIRCSQSASVWIYLNVDGEEIYLGGSGYSSTVDWPLGVNSAIRVSTTTAGTVTIAYDD